MLFRSVRLGSPAGTTRGFGIAEFRQVGELIAEVLDALSHKNSDEDAAVEAAVREKAMLINSVKASCWRSLNSILALLVELCEQSPAPARWQKAY